MNGYLIKYKSWEKEMERFKVAKDMFPREGNIETSKKRIDRTFAIKVP